MTAPVDLVAVSGGTVTIKASSEIKDSGGNSGGGTLTYAVIADVG